MNLHQIVSSAIGAVNPSQVVGIRISVGAGSGADGVQAPVYASPGALTGSIGGTFTASIPDPVNNPTTLNVSAVLTGSLQVGDVVSGTDGTNALPAGVSILSQLSGAAGGVGTYQLSQGGTLNSATVTSVSTTLNVTAVAAGAPQPGQTLADAGALLAGTMITGQLAGSAGGPGLYSVSQAQTVASETMTTAVSILAQIQPLSTGDLRHMDALNLQGSHRALYMNGQLNGAVRIALKGGDMVTLPDGTVWLVTQGMEPFYSSAGWTKAIITLQDGS
jgi:hypothetical protein